MVKKKILSFALRGTKIAQQLTKAAAYVEGFLSLSEIDKKHSSLKALCSCSSLMPLFGTSKSGPATIVRRSVVPWLTKQRQRHCRLSRLPQSRAPFPAPAPSSDAFAHTSGRLDRCLRCRCGGALQSTHCSDRSHLYRRHK